MASITKAGREKYCRRAAQHLSLTYKLEELEQRVLEAENRADHAEFKVRSMERRRTSGECSEKSSVSLEEESSLARDEPVEKDLIIKQLETEVQQQRQLRLEDARQVEAKAARIKSWVTTKLKELEEQNAHLKLQNAHCNDQMEMLRRRLEHMQNRVSNAESNDNVQRKHSLAEDSSLGSFEGEATTTNSCTDDLDSRVRPATSSSNTKKSPLMLADPSIWSNVNSKDSRIDSGSVDLETPDEFSLNNNVFDPVNRAHSQSQQRPSSELGRKDDIGASLQSNNGDANVLPDRRQSVHAMPRTKILLPSDESHDYAEIYSPPMRDSGLTSSDEPHNPAPLPPLHKCPSWEASIYALADNCIDESPVFKAPIYALVNKSNFGKSNLEENVEDEQHKENKTGFTPATLPKLQGARGHVTRSQGHESSQTTPRRRRHRDPSTSEAPQEDRSGYLLKLCTSAPTVRRTWRRRFFLLRNNSLLYYKSSKTDTKPSGVLLLDHNSRVSRSTATQFEVISGGQKWTLATETSRIADEWVKLINSATRLNPIEEKGFGIDEKVGKNCNHRMEGWVTRIKHGHARRVWCVLKGTLLSHYRAPNDEAPLGELDLRDGFVERSERVSSDNSDEETSELSATNNSIAVYTDHVNPEPIYLVVGDEHECELWLYHLTIVSGCRERGTPFENVLQQIMEAENQTSEASNTYALWRHPLLSPLKDASNLSSSLTTLSNDELRIEANKLYKSLLLFTNVVMESNGIDYHVMLAADAFQKCLESPELQDELLCILIKQTGHNNSSGHTNNNRSKQGFLANASHIFHCDSNLSNTSASANITSSPASLQSWMLMSLSVSMFPPSGRLLWFLRAHLRRHKSQILCSETSKYANYCIRALERAIKKGRRLCRPSRLELLSILLKNPDAHSMPHAMPVHLLNKSYRVVGFDGSTTVHELVQTLCLDLGLRPVSENGFALFSDDPLEPNLNHALHPDDKICDIISRWETALRERGQGKFDAARVVRFVLKQRLAWSRSFSNENDKERLLLVYQSAEAINKEAFPLNEQLAQALIALLAQIHSGDLDLERKESMLKQIFEDFFSNLKDKVKQDQVITRWSALRNRSGAECARIFLGCVRKWPMANAATFDVRVSTSTSSASLCSSPSLAAVVVAPEPMFLAVAEHGLAVLEPRSLHVLNAFDYDDVVTFGGCQPDDFMVVVKDAEGNTRKMLFHTNKPEILQITLLIADYMSTRMPATTTSVIAATTSTATTSTARSTRAAGCETPKFARKCRPCP